MNININGLSIAYTDLGRGLPLLFIHGFPLSREMWALQAAELGNVAHVLAPDLRGHGDTPPTSEPYTMDLLAADLNTFLDALSIDQPVVICGMSMGGYVAMAFYRNYPGRLRGLVLTATRAAADTPEGQRARDAAAQQVKEAGIHPLAEGMAAKLLSPGTVAARPELVEQVRALILRTSTAGVINALMGMKVRPDSTDLLEKINIPTLVIHGADDLIVPPEEARAMAGGIPGAHLEIIQDAGHLLNLEQPEHFNHLLSAFWEDLSTSMH